MDELSEVTCPVCGTPPLGPGPGSMVRDPLLTTPEARLHALAMEVGIEVFDDLPRADGIGGAAAVFEFPDERLRVAWTTEGLDDGLRADVLAFLIALLTDPDDPVRHTPGSRVGVRSQRRAAAPDGVGHVAWHLAAGCGRVTRSATFDVFDLPTDPTDPDPERDVR